MFDIGFIEMLVIGLILLLVVGPERLPEVARTVGGWVHQAKSYMDSMKSELDRDLQLSELDQQTRRALDTGSAAEGSGREEGEAPEKLEEPPAGETAEAEAGPARESGPAGDTEAAAADGNGEAGPDAEDQAASDMESELQREEKRDEGNRG